MKRTKSASRTRGESSRRKETTTTTPKKESSSTATTPSSSSSFMAEKKDKLKWVEKVRQSHGITGLIMVIELIGICLCGYFASTSKVVKTASAVASSASASLLKNKQILWRIDWRMSNNTDILGKISLGCMMKGVLLIYALEHVFSAMMGYRDKDGFITLLFEKKMNVVRWVFYAKGMVMLTMMTGGIVGIENFHVQYLLGCLTLLEMVMMNVVEYLRDEKKGDETRHVHDKNRYYWLKRAMCCTAYTCGMVVNSVMACFICHKWRSMPWSSVLWTIVWLIQKGRLVCLLERYVFKRSLSFIQMELKYICDDLLFITAYTIILHCVPL